jgi:Sulfotransferase family
VIDPVMHPLELFNLLREKRIREHVRDGYQKLSPAEIARNPDHRSLVLPFIFVERLQEQLFTALLERKAPSSAREVLDAYATSYFNAWLDYAGLYRRKADYLVAFIPRFLIDAENAVRFFRDYPDGRLIVPVLDPVNWYASALGHTSEYRDVDHAVDLWLRCNENAVATADAFPGQVTFVQFEDLVARPSATVASLLDRLNLSPEPSNLRPTFNGMLVASDSSFGAKFGIDRTVLDRAALVPPGTRAFLREQTEETYSNLKARAERPTSRARCRLARLPHNLKRFTSSS